jgi:UDP-2,3-diacylglucosamine pyrophosphatase LpxH
MKTKYRSVFISDLHLGSKKAQSADLLEFLKSIECDYLYLVGDILDFWAAQGKKLHWTQTESDVVRRILKMSKDTKICYIVGNHDALIRPNLPIELGNIVVRNEMTHVTSDGKHLLVTHGDKFDPFVTRWEAISRLGDWVYGWLLTFNQKINWLRRKLGFKYWSLSKYLKHNSKKALGIIENFESLLLEYAQETGHEGIISGHIHTPWAKGNSFNCGDWVESFSYLAEDETGSIKLLYYR